MAGNGVERALAALAAGEPVLLPTDTVYGLVAGAEREEWARRALRLKGRDASQPTALLAASVEMLLEALPELDDRGRAIVHALLPGPYTLVVPNPARRFRWLAGARPETIGVRVPRLPEPARRVVQAAGPVLATSANEHGGRDPVTVGDVPAAIRDGCGAVVDVGPLPGVPSTVLDLTGPEPRVLREGAAPSADALTRIAAAAGSTIR
jgi:L-threonylcarbamoyladenylate synthase